MPLPIPLLPPPVVATVPVAPGPIAPVIAAPVIFAPVTMPVTVVVPFDLSPLGHPLVTGQVAGIAVNVLVDSGSSVTLIDRDWARARGFTVRPVRGRAFGAGAAVLALAEAPGVELRVGGVAVNREPLIVLDLSRLGTAKPAVVLGADALRRLGAVLDFPNRRLLLHAVP